MGNSWLIKIGLPVLALLLTIWGVFFSGTEKNLSYQIISEVEFKPDGLTNWENFSISYKGKKVKNGGFTTIRIINSGDIPIYPNEYDGSIILKAVKSSKFVNARILSQSPKDLNPVINIKGNVLSIHPLLLNPGDEFSVQAIMSEVSEPINISARIGGIYEVSNLDNSKKQKIETISWLYLLYGLLGLTIYSLIADVITEKYIYKREQKLSIPALLLIIVVTMFAVVVSLDSFTDIRNIDFSWSIAWYLLGMIILSQIIAIPFKVNKKIDGK